MTEPTQLPTLSGAAILAAVDCPSELVPVPEWGGAVRVKHMTGAERDAYEREWLELQEHPMPALVKTRLLLHTLVDEAGQRLFTPDQLHALAAKSSAAIHRVFEAAQRLNLIGGQAVEAAKKNSPEITSAASGSGSLVNSE